MLSEGQCHLKVNVIWRSVIWRSMSFEGQCHLKVNVILRSMSSEYQGHLKVKVIWRSMSSKGQCHLKIKVNISMGHWKRLVPWKECQSSLTLQEDKHCSMGDQGVRLERLSLNMNNICQMGDQCQTVEFS